MSTIVIIDLFFIAAVFGAVLYWIFIAPGRARKRRHEAMYGQQVGHFRTWDAAARKR